MADNIILNAGNTKTDENISNSQTDIATLDTEQLNFHMRTMHIDTVTSLQGSDGEVIVV